MSDKSQNRNFVPDDLSNYKVVRKGQFAINKMKAWQGSYGVSRHDGIVSPAYHVYEIAGVDSSFFHAAIRSRAYVPYFTAASDGVRVGQWDLSATRMREIPFLVPSRSEQVHIVRFLDHADRCLRRYIRAKERLIRLLEELRQAVVHEAVTGQIDVRTGQPYGAYKDSGVGKVPEHWDVRRLKHWVEINGRVLPEDADPDHAFDYLDIGTVTTGRLAKDPERIRFGNAPSRARRIVRRGDTIVSTVRTYLKAVWHARDPVRNGLIASTGFAVLSPRQDAVPEFVSYTCQSDVFTDRVTAESVGIAYPAIAETRFGAFEVCVPPLPEQAAIARFLDDAVERIAEHCGTVRREIELLWEYRTRLIADVVTGKLDVREATTAVPELDSIAGENIANDTEELVTDPDPNLRRSYP
ncbi:MAG: restriction endonuclease subunit S [Gemmatimonadetes bacterium]|nr:restriction endonuclease subunit S [Candidatus Palauibacter rhopaloidicola]